MAIIHFTKKFMDKLADYFSLSSVTEGIYNKSIDSQFVGNDTVVITQVATTPMTNYDKTVDPSKGSRFGAVEEVGDFQYTYHITQDISLDRTVDRGNNDAQYNMKKAGSIMKAYTDERIRPFMDSYRLKKWADEAGIHTELPSDPDDTKILSAIIGLHNQQINNGVPIEGGYLLISRDYITALQLAKQWVEVDSLAAKTLPKGVMGMFDSLYVRPVSNRVFPANVYFMIVYPQSAISPDKIAKFRGITDSENMDGDRIQYRRKFDAFVMPNKADGVAVACKKSSSQAAPAIAIASHKATLTAAGAQIYYTLDGSDPRYPSAEAKLYSSPVSMTEGQTIRACAKKEGKFQSNVVEDNDHGQA